MHIFWYLNHVGVLMHFVVSAFAVVAAVFFATPSFADFDQRFGGDQKPYDWTGFYVGVAGAYTASSLSYANCVGLCPVNPRLDGLVLAVRGGYDRQLANGVVVGGYLTIPVVAPGGGFDPGAAVGFPLPFTYRPIFAAFTGVRLGYSQGRWLPYVHVGGHLVTITADSSFGVSVTNTHLGVQTGAGVEIMLTDRISTDLGYMFSYTGQRSYDFGGGATLWSQTGHTISTGINIRF